MQEKNDEAETFLERVTAQDNENVIAWTLYGMLYEQRGQDLNADITFKQTVKINNALNLELYPPVSNQPEGEEEMDKKEEGDYNSVLF